jgi:hypothetical protein
MFLFFFLRFFSRVEDVLLLRLLIIQAILRLFNVFVKLRGKVVLSLLLNISLSLAGVVVSQPGAVVISLEVRVAAELSPGCDREVLLFSCDIFVVDVVDLVGAEADSLREGVHFRVGWMEKWVFLRLHRLNLCMLLFFGLIGQGLCAFMLPSSLVL